MMTTKFTARELAFCGIFGAAALLLPVIFHLVQLGRAFMPMYIPLVTLAFFVRPLPAAVTAFITPFISGAMTGMPPFFPPVAVFMGIELGTISALISWTTIRWRLNTYIVLIPALIFGRVLYVFMTYVSALFLDLPAAFLATVSLMAGWPGLILMIVVVPPVVKIGNSKRLQGL